MDCKSLKLKNTVCNAPRKTLFMLMPKCALISVNEDRLIFALFNVVWVEMLTSIYAHEYTTWCHKIFGVVKANAGRFMTLIWLSIRLSKLDSFTTVSPFITTTPKLIYLSLS